MAVVAVGTMLAGSLALAKNDNGKGREKEKENKGQHEMEVRKLGSTLELHIFDDGKVLLRGAKVTAVNPTSVNASFSWGSYTLNGVITTDGSTNIIRKYGGRGTLAEFSVGDILSVQGILVPGQSQPTILARIIKNWSVQKKNATLTGTVGSIDAVNSKFVLNTGNQGAQTVSVSSSTMIKRGDVAGTFADIAVNQKVAVKGLWDNNLNTIAADEVRISVEKPEEQKMTLQGAVKTAPASSTAPTSFVLTVGSTDYTVNVAADTATLNNAWIRTSLGNILVGHTVRVYGAVSSTTVDATVVRDVSL